MPEGGKGDGDGTISLVCERMNVEPPVQGNGVTDKPDADDEGSIIDFDESKAAHETTPLDEKIFFSFFSGVLKAKESSKTASFSFSFLFSFSFSFPLSFFGLSFSSSN